MEDDWDLHAVVRGCTTAAPATSTAAASQNLTTFQQDCNFSTSCFQDLYNKPKKQRIVQDELLHDLYKPFFPKSQDSCSQLQFSPLSVLPPPQQAEFRPKAQSFSVSDVYKAQSFSVSDVSKAHNNTPRSKRRKNHLKKVCHVAAENLSCDMWSWRKYGQKPIKGSPYPRGYYRCSTSKGCMARKQVERNRSDPGMFIVTYTAEHNHPMPTHRNSLAGSKRHKPAEATSPELSAAAPEKVESSREDLAEGDDGDDDDLCVSKMALDDDFFAGLEDFTASDCHFPANLQFPWLSSATTIAGGG